MPRTYSGIYNRVRVKLRQDDRTIPNDVIRVLHESLADEISQLRLSRFIRTNEYSGLTLMIGGVNINNLGPGVIGTQIIAIYQPGDSRRLEVLPHKDESVERPYVVGENDLLIGENLDDDLMYQVRYFARYDLASEADDGESDEFFQRNPMVTEYGLMRQVLEWQNADPIEISPMNARYLEAISAARSDPQVKKVRLPL